MSTTCKYCNEPENKQERPGLICDTCICFVHLTCLRRMGTPGEFSCDVFFDFTCADCTPDNKEVLQRHKFPWVNVIILTLHHLNLHSHGISNKGFFHYKIHICSFIDRSWLLLFGPHFKQKKNWIGTIAGILSVYNYMFFQSGSAVLGETGWWRLLHNFSPAVAAHIVQEISRDPHKNRVKNCLADKNHFIEKINKLGYRDLLLEPLAHVSSVPAPWKKRRINSDEVSGVSSTSCYDHLDSGSRIQLHDEFVQNDESIQNAAFEDTMLGLGAGEGSYSDAETVFRGFDFESTNLIPTMKPQSDTSSINSYQQLSAPYDSDSHEDVDDRRNDNKHKINEPLTRENFFSTELNSIDMPWIEKVREDNREKLTEMTQYEEVQLLKQVESLSTKVREPTRKAYLCRLKAKLALRRLKRHKHLPIFDLDKAVKLLGGYVTEEPRTVINAERILDRFQRSYLMDNLSGTVSSTNYGTVLLSGFEPAPFRSPYSGTLLKPFIRREKRTPLWLRVTDELMMKTHKHIKDYKPPPHATLDYSYVRPQHIPAVNSLCAQFFWPGVDLTEALQYPEFSCVVSYKKLVVGCAFLVPDAGHNRAYISFILTRPEWRRASIANFMLYHLLQTCTGKDVTLHVSPTNPAIFLYQKFGFKVEELVQDFYEKYFDIDFKGCRHALFLRLVR